MNDGPMTTGQYLMARRIRAHRPNSTVAYIAESTGATQAQVRKALDAVPRIKGANAPRPTHRRKHLNVGTGPSGRQDAGICEHAGISVPDTVLQERARRLAQSPRSLTAACMGDPPPGYSALDKRQG